MGKYILMFTEVLWTFAKLTVPFCCFLYVLAMASFTLYYKEAFRLAINHVWQLHPQVFRECNDENYTETAEHALDKYFPVDWELLYSIKVRQLCNHANHQA